MMINLVNLSYPIDLKTPAYGNNEQLEATNISSITNGDTGNHTMVNMSLHLGTHIDFPNHFYEEGQSYKDFDENFWIFKSPLIVEIEPKEKVIKEELILKLDELHSRSVDIILVKTGSCYKRFEKEYWSDNYGFHPDIADYIRVNFPNVRIFGFDTISVSSFTDRITGREAHKTFLDPESPILLLEDLNLCVLENSLSFLQIIPIFSTEYDASPCIVIGER